MAGNALEKVRQWPAGLKNYYQELQMEMRRVTWPNRKQVRATTVVVVVSVFAFALYFFVVDLIVGRGITRVFDFFAK